MMIARIGMMLILGAVSAIGPVSGAAAQYLTDHDFQDWQTAQLIFEEEEGPLAEALQAATKSPYTHVGIVRITGGGPVVLDTKPALWENFVEEFIANGVGGHYAVYEVRGLSGDAIFTPARMANDYLNAPDDPYLRPGGPELSGAELVQLVYRSVGYELGRSVRFEDLDIERPEFRRWFETVWRDHPDCTARSLDRKACRALVGRQMVLTPASIAADPKVICVWSNFAADKGRCPGPR
ncbi:hypothetical protein [Jiella mangrovi]|uniref:Uncharacterized protein n=1 Tax=Jiella mangrovi TaxID=2821407 RepID=A0ABS4BJJ4_9HYPH|nr:hypothetical protein [Jiella mangrovi]MBP0616717.1 hypothetical protein [Jiella mangrovi]